MPDGVFLFLFGVLLFVAAGIGRVVVSAPFEWTLPLVVGGVAAMLAAVYQHWWARNVFR